MSGRFVSGGTIGAGETEASSTTTSTSGVQQQLDAERQRRQEARAKAASGEERSLYDVLQANKAAKEAAAAEAFRRNIEAGQVGINVPIPVPLPMFSFTGNKKSIAGGGASTFYGKPGINFYTQLKTVTALWQSNDAVAKKASVVMPTQQ
ncbi:hypothetical protein NLG97_g2148 [Lecanicillium saksenae]|uniref:Uncharacterized protein n=1 Tax=Lecanicillium saksenae TaxID=468837 RepID=A0ACC1R3H6_9HYPO|nr:hypothetical protein NLG97_g2148 [Lecanicillium saksenae]